MVGRSVTSRHILDVYSCIICTNNNIVNAKLAITFLFYRIIKFVQETYLVCTHKYMTVIEIDICLLIFCQTSNIDTDTTVRPFIPRVIHWLPLCLPQQKLSSMRCSTCIQIYSKRNTSSLIMLLYIFGLSFNLYYVSNSDIDIWNYWIKITLIYPAIYESRWIIVEPSIIPHQCDLMYISGRAPSKWIYITYHYCSWCHIYQIAVPLLLPISIHQGVIISIGPRVTRPPVRPVCRVRSVPSTVLDGFLPY